MTCRLPIIFGPSDPAPCRRQPSGHDRAWPTACQSGFFAALAGIGFTVSLFITELAFDTAVLADRAKIGIFVGSAVAGLLGWLLIRGGPMPPPEGEQPRVPWVDEAVASDEPIGAPAD